MTDNVAWSFTWVYVEHSAIDSIDGRGRLFGKGQVAERRETRRGIRHPYGAACYAIVVDDMGHWKEDVGSALCVLPRRIRYIVP